MIIDDQPPLNVPGGWAVSHWWIGVPRIAQSRIHEKTIRYTTTELPVMIGLYPLVWCEGETQLHLCLSHCKSSLDNLSCRVWSSKSISHSNDRTDRKVNCRQEIMFFLFYFFLLGTFPFPIPLPNIFNTLIGPNTCAFICCIRGSF